MKPEVIAVIPARGGSKGVLRKNVKLICGKPLIGYTIEAALSAQSITRTCVSTEDEQIARISGEFGAEVIPRPRELANDETPTEPVMEHVLSYMYAQEGYEPDIVVLLQPTSPLRRAKHIDAAMAEFLTKGYDSLLSVCPSKVFIWQAKEGTPHPINYDCRNRQRRQDREAEYRENGAIYITRRKLFLQEHNRLGGKIGLYIMPVEISPEIDTEFQLWLCEQIIKDGRYDRDIQT